MSSLQLLSPFSYENSHFYHTPKGFHVGAYAFFTGAIDNCRHRHVELVDPHFADFWAK
jgi:hypothetical protein